ncbi:MAG: hypothetical protein ACRDIE_12360 [Chloroflexota bacterium]
MPPIHPRAVRRAARDIAAFSEHVLARPLRPYQTSVARAIVDSVLAGQGRTFSVLMARQMGKNELSAHIEVYLLNLRRRAGGTLIKAAPTLRPQALISQQRLHRLLDNPLNRGRWRASQGTVELGRARARFLSGSPGSNVVGATADILLELDEAQDLEEDKIQREFRPMASSTNATIVLYGTAWDGDSPLERQKQLNLDLERRDGIQRHFEYDWRVLAALSPPYRAFVEGEIARLGEEHPLIRTQYLLRPLEAAGRLFPPATRALLEGSHSLLEGGQPGEVYVAGVDVAGQDDAALPGLLRAGRTVGGRDSTVVTVARLAWDDEGEPAIEVVRHYAWAGADHPTQHHALRRLLSEVFPCVRVVVDATGLGAGVASWLEGALGAAVVESFVFNAAAKSRLGFSLLAMAGTGRCRVYREDGSAEAARCRHEIAHARYELGGNEQLRFHVPANEGHDDYLISLALCVHAAGLAATPPISAVIPSRREPEERW